MDTNLMTSGQQIGGFILDGLAIIISFGALALSILQYTFERKRACREATISAFSELQHDVLDSEEFNGIDIEKLVAAQKDDPSEEDMLKWEKMNGYLARIEQFAVGINLKIFDLKTLDRMAGSHIIKIYRRVEPIICHKREKSKTTKRYEEFEKMVDSLKPYNKGI